MIKPTTFGKLPLDKIFYLHPDHAKAGERLWCKINDTTGEQRPKLANTGGQLHFAASRGVWIRG